MASRAPRWRRSASSSRTPTSPPSSATSATPGETSQASCSRRKSKRGANKGIAMSSVVDTHDHGHGHDHAHDAHDHHTPYGGVMRWITTTNNKETPPPYLWFAGIMFFIRG